MLPQTRVRSATISTMPRVVILTSLKTHFRPVCRSPQKQTERENRLRGASVVALSLIYSLDQRTGPMDFGPACGACHRAALRADPLAHPGMTNKRGASRACETPASFG